MDLLLIEEPEVGQMKLGTSLHGGSNFRAGYWCIPHTFPLENTSSLRQLIKLLTL